MATQAFDRSIDGLLAADATEHESQVAAVAALPATADHPISAGPDSRLEVREFRRPQRADDPTGEPLAAGRPSPGGHRVARNLGALMGGQAITWTFTLIWTLIVPRALGPVGLGILVAAQSVSGVLGIALGIGARDYLVRESVLTPSAGPRLVGTVFAARLAIAPLVALGAVVWARLGHYGHDATLVLYLITAMTVFNWLIDALQAAFQSIEHMKYIAYGNVINKVAQSITGIALVIVGFKVVGIAADMAIMAGIVILLSWWWLRPYFRIDLRTNAGMIGRVTRESLPYWATGVFWMIYFWIDTIMLTVMTNASVVGWYGASTQLFLTLMFLPALVGTAWLPRLVAAFGKSRRRLHETARAPIELVLILSLPIAASTIVVADPLIRAVYGTQFAQAVPVMIILALCIPPLYLESILCSVLVAEKRQATWTIVMAGAAVVNPLMNLVLIPLTQRHYHNGAIGAAISLVLTELLMVGAGLFLVGRYVFDWPVVKRCGLMCLASTSMVAAAELVRPFGTVPSVVAGFTTVALLVLVLRIVTPDDVALGRSALAHVRARLPGKSALRCREAGEASSNVL